MSTLDLRLVGADVLVPNGVAEAPVRLADGGIVSDAPGREIDLGGFLVAPGIVDIHGDGFERHLAPRRGAMKDVEAGLLSAEAELAANGITSAVLAQFYSWEGGMRGPDFAEAVFGGVAAARARVATDLHLQMRLEVAMLDDYGAAEEVVARHGVRFVVFNDHLPHDALEQGKRPPRLTGQALKVGRNPERHLEMMQAMHARMDEVPVALDTLCARLGRRGVLMGCHDARTAEALAEWRGRGVRVAEFPETAEAVEAARDAGDPVVMGAPNVVRGGSHNGNVSAAEQVMMGQVTALASDYHYPSLTRAVRLLVGSGVLDLSDAWRLISEGPAGILGLTDRGSLQPGRRADLVVLEPGSLRVVATIAGGRISYMSGEAAARFVSGGS